MRRIGMSALLTFGLLTLTGCATLDISGDGGRFEQRVNGAVRIHGEDIELAILPGSRVTTLSLLGADIHVVFARDARVQKVEIVGNDNRVTVPAGAQVEFSEVGEGNELIYLTLE